MLEPNALWALIFRNPFYKKIGQPSTVHKQLEINEKHSPKERSSPLPTSSSSHQSSTLPKLSSSSFISPDVSDRASPSSENSNTMKKPKTIQNSSVWSTRHYQDAAPRLAHPLKLQRHNALAVYLEQPKCEVRRASIIIAQAAVTPTPIPTTGGGCPEGVLEDNNTKDSKIKKPN